MMPTLSRSEMNNASDIIREFGLRPIRRQAQVRPTASGSSIAGCEGKASFLNKDAADQSARRGCVSYRCRYCRSWHIGSVNKSK